jgi:hypothetical protein
VQGTGPALNDLMSWGQTGSNVISQPSQKDSNTVQADDLGSSVLNDTAYTA